MKEENRIDASPSKQLFIEMLTRDVLLIPAILDVADNCVDGARRLKGETASFKGLWVKIETNDHSFKITDNCGGIEVDIARKYAFRFGRDNKTPAQKHSIGRFGVGLKRAIFKMGSAFSISSVAPTSSFSMSVDVNKWADRKEWDFEFSKRNEDEKNKTAETGTTLEIKPLHREVAASFEIPTFESELASELMGKLQEALRRGLSISVNNTVIHADIEKVIGDAQLAPAELKRKFTAAGTKPVNVKLLCGLGESDDPSAAGWHLYCNGRLVLQGDKSNITGWDSEGNGISIPGFHAQYNRFRGYAYFDSEDAGMLPWNTSKTAINADSVIYQAVRLDMIRLMRPIIDFCNQVKTEREQIEEGKTGPLLKLIQNASLLSVNSVKTREIFAIPKVVAPSARTGPAFQRIQYDRPLKQIDAAKKILKARSYKEVGEKTFDYFYNNEVKE
jgi:hypothetical protein